MPKAKRMRARPTMSQRVKQEQTVKINIKNLIPQDRSGDYITPHRGMPRDNFNMGNMSRLVAPSIHYAVRPPEFLPLPERINSQGQPEYFRAGVPRQGRPDLITQETNPSDIAPARPALVAIPPKPVIPTRGRTTEQILNDFERQARETLGRGLPISIPMPAHLSQQDESEAAVAAASDQDVRDIRAAQQAMNRSLGAKKAWETRRMQNPAGTAAATTGVPNVPAHIQIPSTPQSPPIAESEYENPMPYAAEAGHPMSAQSRYGRKP